MQRVPSRRTTVKPLSCSLYRFIFLLLIFNVLTVIWLDHSTLNSKSNISSISTKAPTLVIPSLDPLSIEEWSMNQNMQDIFVSCSPEACGEHVANTPPSLWNEFEKNNFRLVYVVGNGVFGRTRAVNALHEQARKVLALESALYLPVAIMSLEVEETSPNVNVEKDLLTLWSFAQMARRDLFVRADSDTLIHPRRLFDLLSTLNSTDSMYLGQPLSCCDCKCTSTGSDCKYTNAVHFCSGAFFVSSRQTLKRLPKTAFEITDHEMNATCRSSDMTIGAMLNTHINVKCDMLQDPRKGDHKYPGLAYPMSTLNRRQRTTTPICQQTGTSSGGIHDDRRSISIPFYFTFHHESECVVAHPMKRRPDFQYAWNRLSRGGDDSLAVDVLAGQRYANTIQCEMAVMVPTAPHRFDVREAVRQTWGRNAKAMGMQVFFTIGSQTTPLRMTEAQLDYENATQGDLVFSPHVDGYQYLAVKHKAGYARAAATRCTYFAKVDADTYFRPYQALKAMQILASKYPSGSEFYVGHIWKNGKVVRDPKSPWYNPWVEEDRYPPFASGYCYILSMTVARRALKCIQESPIQNVEDVMSGLCIHKVKGDTTRIQSIPQLKYDSDCTDETIADNAVVTPHVYNIYQRHEANIRGAFCDLGKRKFTAPGRNYVIGTDTFDLTAVSASKSNYFLESFPPPWIAENEVDDHEFTSLEDAMSSSTQRKRVNDILSSVVITSPKMKQNYRAEILKCTSCMSGWYLVLQLPNNKKAGTRPLMSRAVSVNADLKTATFGPSWVSRTVVDVVLLDGCEAAHSDVLNFANMLQAFQSWDLNWIIPQCKDDESVKDFRVATKWPKASDRVVRASAARSNILDGVIGKLRSSSLVVLSSSHHRFQPDFVSRSASLVQHSQSMYAPTLLAHDGKSSIYVVASEDIKEAKSLDKLKTNLHVIHMKDPDLQKA